MKTRKSWIVVCGTMMLMVFVMAVSAEGQSVDRVVAPAGSNTNQGPTEKLGRGTYNFFLGGLEVFNQPVNTVRRNWGASDRSRQLAVMKIPEGVAKGVYEGGKRVMYGGYEMLTFWRPNPGGYQYQSVVQPDYPEFTPR